MSPEIVAAVSAVLVALLTGGGLAALLNARNTRQLTAAQAGTQEMSTVEVVDRIARQSLETLERRLAASEERADEAEREMLHERRVNRAAFSYIERLLDYIAGRGGRETPPMPAELADYIGGGA